MEAVNWVMDNADAILLAAAAVTAAGVAIAKLTPTKVDDAVAEKATGIVAILQKLNLARKFR